MTRGSRARGLGRPLGLAGITVPRWPVVARPSLVGLVGLAALLTVLLTGCGSDPVVERPRNVILFVVDTLRADRLGCYGYERDTSPNIDLLAARGTLYQNNRSQAPWTVPSMISMMTGLYITDEEQTLPPNQPSLAELLQERGIVTSAFIGNRVLTTKRGFERGFDHFEYDGRTRAMAIQKRFQEWYTANETALDASDGFFAWLHPLDPHHPYEPKDRFNVFEGPRPGQEQLEERWMREAPRLRELSPDLMPWDVDRSITFMERESNYYDGEVLACDGAMKYLLEFLQDRGVLHETLIIFAADHGELLYEYPHYPLEISLKQKSKGGLPRGIADLMAVGHRAWYYPELWNTPLILSGPGVPGGQVREGLSGNLDIWPTILDAFGVDVGGLAIDGLDLRAGQSLLGGVDPDRERVFAHGFETTAVLERGGLQLIDHIPGRFLLEDDASRPLELYDLNVTGEIVDRRAEREGDAERLHRLLEDWRETYGREVVITVPGKEAEDALRELGYLDD